MSVTLQQLERPIVQWVQAYRYVTPRVLSMSTRCLFCPVPARGLASLSLTPLVFDMDLYTLDMADAWSWQSKANWCRVCQTSSNLSAAATFFKSLADTVLACDATGRLPNGNKCNTRRVRVQHALCTVGHSQMQWIESDSYSLPLLCFALASRSMTSSYGTLTFLCSASVGTLTL